MNTSTLDEFFNETFSKEFLKEAEEEYKLLGIRVYLKFKTKLHTKLYLNKKDRPLMDKTPQWPDFP